MNSTTLVKTELRDRWAVTHLCSTSLNKFLLCRLDPGRAGQHWKDGITTDVVDFIVSKCKCACCGSAIKVPLVPCACGLATEHWGSPELVAAYPSKVLDVEVKRLYARQTRRIRTDMVKANGGKITLQDKASLFTAQEGMCYYCSESLVDGDGRNRYHCDHFVALINGGRSDLENSVLACQRCNILKRRDDGHYFIRRVRRLQLISDPSRLAKMRKALGLWRKSRGLPALSTLGSE